MTSLSFLHKGIAGLVYQQAKNATVADGKLSTAGRQNFCAILVNVATNISFFSFFISSFIKRLTNTSAALTGDNVTQKTSIVCHCFLTKLTRQKVPRSQNNRDMCLLFSTANACYQLMADPVCHYNDAQTSNLKAFHTQKRR